MLVMHPNASLHVRNRNFASRLRDPAETPRLNAAFVHGFQTDELLEDVSVWS